MMRVVYHVTNNQDLAEEFAGSFHQVLDKGMEFAHLMMPVLVDQGVEKPCHHQVKRKPGDGDGGKTEKVPHHTCQYFRWRPVLGKRRPANSYRSNRPAPEKFGLSS
jgi:hypothetical protein